MQQHLSNGDETTSASRHAERLARAAEVPIIGGLPDMPGILAAMMISPDLARSLRSLADTLLVDPFPGASLDRADRELIATAVSAGNGCFYCMDTHGAFASALLERQGIEMTRAEQVAEAVKTESLAGVSEKLKQLIHLALITRHDPRSLSVTDVTAAREAGATDGDVQLTILISAAFCMYNRIVDGFRARTPADPSVFRDRAQQIADYGYSDQRVTAIPNAA